MLTAFVLIAVAQAPVEAGIQSPRPAQASPQRRRTATRSRKRDPNWPPAVLQRFAYCFVEENAETAAAIVDPPLAAGEAVRRALLSEAQRPIERCLAIALDRARVQDMLISADLIGMPVLLGAMAEALYARRFATLPALGSANLPPLADPKEAPVHLTYLLANCLIDQDAAAVDGLVRSRVGSDEEHAAFAALTPRYSGCLDRGSAMHLNRTSLRAALADQLYRRAIAR